MYFSYTIIITWTFAGRYFECLSPLSACVMEYELLIGLVFDAVLHEMLGQDASRGNSAYEKTL